MSFSLDNVTVAPVVATEKVSKKKNKIVEHRPFLTLTKTKTGNGIVKLNDAAIDLLSAVKGENYIMVGTNYKDARTGEVCPLYVANIGKKEDVVRIAAEGYGSRNTTRLYTPTLLCLNNNLQSNPFYKLITKKQNLDFSVEYNEGATFKLEQSFDEDNKVWSLQYVGNMKQQTGIFTPALQEASLVEVIEAVENNTSQPAQVEEVEVVHGDIIPVEEVLSELPNLGGENIEITSHETSLH